MSKTFRKVTVSRKIHKNEKDVKKLMTIDEYLTKLRVTNLRTGIVEW